MPRTLIAPALAVALVGVSLAVQAATGTPQDQRPTFKARTDIVRIDVTVLGPDGKPVHGLAREEFTILENGKPREILGFGEVNIPDATTMPPWYREVRPDVRSAMNGRVLIFVLDDAQTQYCLEIESWINTVKRITDELIDRMGPQDVAAVICTYDNRCDQDFTTDHQRLKAAIAQFRPKEAFIGLRVSAGITQSVAKYLKTEQGRRRSLIYVTPQMPIRPRCWAPSSTNPTACTDTSSVSMYRPEPPAARPVVQPAPSPAPRPALDGGVAAARRSSAACRPPSIPGLEWSGTGALNAQQIIHTFEEAMRSGITVYGLSLWGLLPLGTEDQVDDLSIVPPPPGANGLRFTAPERSLAAETGGFMISRPGDLADGAEQIIAETGSYYLLGFEPPPKADTGYNMLDGFREIEVVVNRPGLTIKTKRGYIVAKPPKPDPNPPPPAAVALQGILPKTDLPLSVTAAPFAVPGSSEALVAIGIGVSEPSPDKSRMEKLEVQARAFTQGGDQRGGVIHKVETLVEATGGLSNYDVAVQLRLKPGVYAIRSSVDNTTLGLAGSVYADIEIPDFAKAPLSLSGVLLQVTPTPPLIYGASNILAGLPSAPTTLRAFTAANRVKAFLRVYQGSGVKLAPVQFTMYVLDESGAKVYEQASELAPALFATNRGADVTVDVPVRRFSPGLHLLRIEVFNGSATARRDVTFRVN